MRPPNTYALIPLLVGLPVCTGGYLTIENFVGCWSVFALLYWGVKKTEPRSLVYRKIIGMFLGLALVYLCNREQFPKNGSIMENEHSNTWWMMPPRELDLSLRISGKNDLRIKNDTKYQVYEGYVINAPEVRMDLIDKKVTWILKKRNDFQVMLKGDTVYLGNNQTSKFKRITKRRKEEINTMLTMC